MPEATASEWRFQRQIKCGGTGETGLPVNTSAHEPYSAETEGLTVRRAQMRTWPPVFYLARLFVKYTMSDRELEEKFNLTMMSALQTAFLPFI